MFFQRRRLLAVLAVVFATLVVPVPGAHVPPASAAVGEGADWFPLASNDVVMGCTWGGTYCSHHSYMALDLIAPEGTAVYAAGPGTAARHNWSGAGLTVEITHTDGTRSRYMHLASFSVADGQSVVAGTLIGRVGRTGNVTGSAHLHYEEWDANGNRQDPGELCALQNHRAVTFPAAGGYPSWTQVPPYWEETNDHWPTNHGYWSPSTGPFADVADTHRFADEINWMGTSGTSTGWSSRCSTRPEFRWVEAVSRQALAAFQYRLAGAPSVSATPHFADVGPSHPLFEAIQWMYETGASTGWDTDGALPEFRPGETTSRQSMAAFFHRLHGSPTPASTEPHFSDVALTHPFFDAIQWMYESGVSTGTANGDGLPLYKPGTGVSRQAMAAFLFRAR